MQTKEIKITKCPLCGRENIFKERISGTVIYEINCENCGKYKVSDVILIWIKKIKYEEKKAIVWYAKNNTDISICDDKDISHIRQKYKIHLQK